MNEGIPFEGAEMFLVFRCRMCGELVLQNQTILDLVMFRRLTKPRKCPDCQSYLRGFELVPEESVIRRSSNKTGDKVEP